MNVLDWTHGTHGKGIIDEDGHVHTFNEDDYPTHTRYAVAKGVRPSAYFYLAKDGRIDLSKPHPQYDTPQEVDAAIHAIKKADPTLYYAGEPDETWDFGKA